MCNGLNIISKKKLLQTSQSFIYLFLLLFFDYYWTVLGLVFFQNCVEIVPPSIIDEKWAYVSFGFGADTFGDSGKVFSVFSYSLNGQEKLIVCPTCIDTTEYFGWTKVLDSIDGFSLQCTHLLLIRLDLFCFNRIRRNKLLIRFISIYSTR